MLHIYIYIYIYIYVYIYDISRLRVKVTVILHWRQAFWSGLCWPGGLEGNATERVGSCPRFYHRYVKWYSDHEKVFSGSTPTPQFSRALTLPLPLCFRILPSSCLAFLFIWYDIWCICWLQLGWHPVAVVQYAFTHKQYTEQHNHLIGKSKGRAPSLRVVYPGICLTTEEKARKNLSQGRYINITIRIHKLQN